MGVMLRSLQDASPEGALGHDLQGCSVCEYGCGSALLALAALALGATRAIGIDIVLDALDAAAQNARANVHLSGWAECEAQRKLHLFLPHAETLDKDLDFYCRYGKWQEEGALKGWSPLPDSEHGTFDVVVANIVIGPLCNSASAVFRLVRPGGQVLLSGMRQGLQTEKVEEVYSGAGFVKIRRVLDINGWTLLEGKRPV